MKHDVRKRPRPEWLKDGVILVSLQEPLAFLRRVGYAGVNPREKHFAPYTEESVLQWKDQGVNLVMVSGQKGAGFQAEAENIEASRRMAELCHKHGLHVGTYIGDTLLTETFFNEVPEARQWVQINAYGAPVYYAWGGQTFRQKGCRNNPGYLNFLKEATRRCIQEIGADFLHYDNMYIYAEPHACHCEICRDKFRGFIRAKYTDEALLDRFGFSDVELLGTPDIMPGQEPQRRPEIKDPLLQEWIDFQCLSQADAYGALAGYARSLKPDVVVECNPYGLGSFNNFMHVHVDHSRLLPHGDAFWSEEDEYAQVRADGEMWTKIRSCKLARTMDQVLLTHIPRDPESPYLVSVCEALAFNQGTLTGPPPPHGRVKALHGFHKTHVGLYRDTETLADAAILRQFHTMAFFTQEPRQQVQMAEQTLIQAHVPFDIIFDQQLDDARRYRVLILADVRCLSDEQIERIRGMVHDGLGLVVTGQTSSCDHWVRSRTELGLGDLIGFGSPEHVAWRKAGRRLFGKGRVAYLPVLTPEKPFRVFDASLGAAVQDIHRLPANWRELAEAISWAADGLSVEVEAPPTVACEFLKQAATDRLVIHLVNYQPLAEVENIRIVLSADLARRYKKVEFVSPDAGAAQATMESTKNSATIVVPSLEAYGMVVLSK